MLHNPYNLTTCVKRRNTRYSAEKIAVLAKFVTRKYSFFVNSVDFLIGFEMQLNASHVYLL